MSSNFWAVPSSYHVPVYRVHHSRMSPQPLRRAANRLCTLQNLPAGQTGYDVYEECVQASKNNANPYCGEQHAVCDPSGCNISSVKTNTSPLYGSKMDCEQSCDSYGYICPLNEGGEPVRMLGATVKDKTQLKCFGCFNQNGTPSLSGLPTDSCKFSNTFKGDEQSGAYVSATECKADANLLCGWKYGCAS